MAARIFIFFAPGTFSLPGSPKFFLQDEKSDRFGQGFLFAVRFGLLLRGLLFVEFCGHNVTVARIFHGGEGEVTPGLELAE